MPILQNETCTVQIDTCGAELRSVTIQGEEFLWQRSNDSWDSTAPLLFPVVGRCRDGVLTVSGKAYPMPLHGFARSRTFSVMPDTEVCSVTLTDRADAKTLVHYPYSYEIMVTYTLTGYSLRVDYKVINHGDEPMYYALGGHPGFCCDFGRAPGDWVLRFSQPELLYSRRVYDTGIISNTQWFRVFDQHGDLPLTRELFCHDALIFERLRSQTLSLINTRTGKAVAMDISAFPYVGVWSPCRDDAAFVCLEPWQSMGMSEHEGSELSQKRGMHCLAPKAWEETGFSMTFQPPSNH